jgi:hypothetical protein
LVYQAAPASKAASILPGIPLTGPQFVAELYAGADAGSLAPITSSISRFRAATSINAGKWTATTITGQPNDFIGLPVDFGGVAFLQVKVWDFDANGGTVASSTYESASGSKGQSIIFTYQAPSDSIAHPPPDYFMEGLQSFSIAPVPEPSMVALGVLGLIGMSLCRKRWICKL